MAVQVEGSSGSRVLGCSVAPGAPTLGCCCGLSQKSMGGEECGSRCATLTIWRECQGERAASRNRNKSLYPHSTNLRKSRNVFKVMLCSYCVADRLVFV